MKACGRCATSVSRSRRAKLSASSGRTARARARCCRSSPASSGRRAARSKSAAGSPRCSNSARAFLPNSPAATTCISTHRCSACRARKSTPALPPSSALRRSANSSTSRRRTYSTGMVLRLAFAVAAHVDPEILIVDEALAVGDISFRQRCMRRIHDLRARGTTLLFVSHETSDLKALCERCLWLQNGAVQDLGNTDEVVARYLKSTLQRDTLRAPEAFVVPTSDLGTDFTGHRYGDGRATIMGAKLMDFSGNAGDRVILKMSFRLNEPVSFPIAGFLLRNARGVNIFGSNTAREDYPLSVASMGDVNNVVFHWTMPALAPRFVPLVAGNRRRQPRRFQGMRLHRRRAGRGNDRANVGGGRGLPRIALCRSRCSRQ